MHFTQLLDVELRNCLKFPELCKCLILVGEINNI